MVQAVLFNTYYKKAPHYSFVYHDIMKIMNKWQNTLNPESL